MDIDSIPFGLDFRQHIKSSLLWLLIELGMMKGTAGANGFGPEPLA